MLDLTDDERIKTAPHWRKTATVQLREIGEPFTVTTREGPIVGKAGDCLAYDRATGDRWIISADFVRKNYEPVGL